MVSGDFQPLELDAVAELYEGGRIHEVFDFGTSFVRVST
jgi:hypothetical protein